MTLIRLHHPIASARRLTRLHLFPGRHLGADEFDQLQAYADARLEALVRGAQPGIVSGLELNLGLASGLASGGVDTEIDLDAAPEVAAADDRGFLVGSGVALAGNGQVLGLYFPLRGVWRRLIEDYLRSSQATNAAGVYYLVLERQSHAIDAAPVDPCQRGEPDPTRDSRLLVIGRLRLLRLTIDPAVADDPDSRETIENWIAADRVDATFLSALGSAVPLALLAIGGSEPRRPIVRWISEDAGRYEAVPHSGYRVLLRQTSAAMRRAMQAADLADEPLADFLARELDLDYLPAAGQLPLDWLVGAATPTPELLWLPPFVGVDMVPVPEAAVPELIASHLPRQLIDLRRPAGDQVRVLLAVNEPDYRRDLLDIPETDSVLEDDVYRLFMRAHDAWAVWRQQFDLLYHLNDESALSPAQIKALDLPAPPLSPPLPRSFYGALIERAVSDLGGSGVPFPFDQGIPDPPRSYESWLVIGTDGRPRPPEPRVPSEDGLIPRYAIGLVELDAIENQLREMRTRLEKTRDYLLLQRQQLDSQTVALAALAGGVAGDGSGLQVARWMPFTKLDSAAMVAPQEPAPKAARAASSPPGDAPSIRAARADRAAPAGAFMLGQLEAPVAKTSLVAKTFDGALATLAGASAAASAFSSGIKNQPASASAFELTLNQSRLSLLANIPKAALTRPAFSAKEYRFGVMDHIHPEVNEYAKAYGAMRDLISTIDGLFDVADAKSLKAKLRRPGTLQTPEVVEASVPAEAKENRSALLSQARYAALFHAGKILTQQIAIVEARYNAIESKLERKLREHNDKQAELQKLVALLRAARETLETMDRFRVEQLGDYGVAQRLLEEDWYRVHTTNRERTRVLTTGLRGLYYVRCRTTAISSPLADPLALRHGSAKDEVPGADFSGEVELPAALEPFFTAVTELPMSDWSALRPLIGKLPVLAGLERAGESRKFRLERLSRLSDPAASHDVLSARLSAVRQQTRSLVDQWAVSSLPTFAASQRRTQDDAARVLSLEDAQTLSAGALRKTAHELRDKLEHCVHNLLQKLAMLQPSLRLAWAQLAEDDHLHVEDVAWWPGLERAEREEFNATRTVAELVAWWFQRLAPEASAGGKAALHNMIRATLIFASLGDPSEIVRGKVQVPPRVALIGERLQVKLDKMPPPGTRLQLLDPEQRVVALLSVEDHSAQGTHVKLVELVARDIRINTRFTVLGNPRTTSPGGR